MNSAAASDNIALLRCYSELYRDSLGTAAWSRTAANGSLVGIRNLLFSPKRYRNGYCIQAGCVFETCEKGSFFELVKKYSGK